MKSKTVLGTDGTTKMREITVGIHGKGGEAGIKAVQRLAGMVSSLKQCRTPQEVYDRDFKGIVRHKSRTAGLCKTTRERKSQIL